MTRGLGKILMTLMMVKIMTRFIVQTTMKDDDDYDGKVIGALIYSKY